MKIKPFTPLSIVGSFIAGAAVMVAVDVHDGVRVPKSRIENRESEIAPVPHYVAADTAIARFGIAPVNPDWLQVTHKLTGEQLQAVPSHEWAVFTFAFEPKVEKIEQPNGVALWKVTFEP